MTDRDEAMTRTLDLLVELLGSGRRDAIDQALASARVRLMVTSADLADARTQAAVYALTMLLVRSGMSLEADLAHVRRRVDLPGLTGEDFAVGLAAVVPRMFPAADIGEPLANPDSILAIGDVPVDLAANVIRLSADGSVASVTRGHQASAIWEPRDGLSALASAAMAAGEVLKDVLRPLAASPLEVLTPLEPAFEVPIGVGGRIDLGRLVLVSAGAISQQFLLVLTAVEGLSAELVVFDRDNTELSNANRCPYVMVDKLGGPKVLAIADLLPVRIQLTPIPSHLTGETRSSVPPGSAIVVGADDISVRHLAQRLDPDWLAIGATSHFLALVTEHPRDEPCAGCAHVRLGDDIAVIPTWSIISFWSGFLVALRAIARAMGQPCPPSRRVTNFWPLRPEAIFEHDLAFNRDCPVRDHSLEA